MYVYKVYWSVDEKAQSAWGRYLFPTTDTVLFVGFINSVMYTVIQRADGIFLESSNMQEGYTSTGLDFPILLDRQTTLTGVYNAGTTTTTWTLPYTDAAAFSVVKGSTWPTEAGGKINTTRTVGDTTIEASGDYSAYPCQVGRNYDMLYRFSEQFVRDTKGIAVQSGNLVIKNMRVNYADSGYFQVEVTPLSRAKNTYAFTGGKLGSVSSQIGAVSISTGSFKFPVRTKPLGSVIDITSDSHLPCTFQSAEWIGEYITKSQRA